ncbi:MAG: prenyltransferase [Vicinamibacterales bacterium]
MTTIKQYVVATRPWSFSMSAISVSLGTLIASTDVAVSWGSFAAVLAGIVFCHAAGNVLNDYFDTKSRVDRVDSATAIYRPHPVFAGLMSPRMVLAESVVLFALAAALGVALILARSAIILWIALAGLFLAVFYTGRPLNLKYRALGEVVVFLIWGPLMFEGAYVAQAGRLSPAALVASIPFGVLVALVLFANNIRDIEHDETTGIRTLATVLGRERSLVAFAGLMVAAYLYVLVAVALSALSAWSFLVFLSLPVALGLLRKFRVAFPPMADALTAQLDTVFGLLFMAAMAIDRFTR